MRPYLLWLTSAAALRAPAAVVHPRTTLRIIDSIANPPSRVGVYANPLQTHTHQEMPLTVADEHGAPRTKPAFLPTTREAATANAFMVPAAAATLFATIRFAPMLGAWYSAAAMATPMGCAAGTAVVKGVCSDVFAQLAVERRRTLDRMRTLAFASFGGLYLGAFASFKYGCLYPRLFGSTASLATVSAKVGVDMFISGPFIYFPLYYIVKGLFRGQGLLSSIREYLSPGGLSILKRYWTVWVPVSVVMWNFVPAHLRIAFLCSVSLLWQVALSTLSYRGDASGHADGASADKGNGNHAATMYRHHSFPIMMDTTQENELLHIWREVSLRSQGVSRIIRHSYRTA